MKRKLSILLIIAMAVTGILSLPNRAYAVTTYQKVTKYHLDIGAQHIWGIGDSLEKAIWQNGNAKGGTIDVSATLTFGTEVSNVKAYKLTSSNFDWNQASTDGSTNYTFNGTRYLTDGSTYDEYYKNYASNNIYNINYSSSGNKVYLSYTATLNSKWDFNLKDKLNTSGLAYILDLLGGEDTVKSKYPDTYNRLTEGAKNGIASNVYGFMYFTPVVIQYDVIEAVEIPVGDFKPGLDVPESAKVGEQYTVTDTTVFGEPKEFAVSKLYYSVNGGSKNQITDWDGSKLGGSIKQSFDEVCTVTYTLIVWNIYGDEKSVSKSINITDNREVNGKAILELPEYTYEGHPALAKDISTFVVDGINYSAVRAYEEGVADNDFEPSGSCGSVSRLNSTKANVTFSKRGNYTVTLLVDLINGNTLTDIKPIEVRKTPYIIDSLGGFQKENRKEILTASVATYPGKPITDYYVELKDLKTNQSITLTAAQPQVNNATIKTRTIKKDGDEYWTNFTLEFLTKNTTSQDYQYTIYMKDSKGDTDSVQKTFTVAPDLPPVPEIIMQDSFIRNKGTNVAEITTEDASTTDGDQLERIWSVDETNLKSFDGYKDLSFGTGQKVKFNKIGVGSVDVKLDVKDIWIEPTLEEYVTDADHKRASVVKTTDVINIAPTVRLEPKNMKEAEITIITDKSHKTALGSGLNALKAALIELGYDPKLSLAVAPDADEGPYRRVASWEWDTALGCPICQENAGQMDSEYVYRITSPGKVSDGYYSENCITNQPHVLQALSAGTEANSGYVVWSYPVNESRNFTFYLDNKEKYIYIACSDINKTIILNRDNGAYLTTLNMAIPGTPFLDDDAQRLYFIGSSAITKYDTSSGVYSMVMNRGGSLVRMMNGKITFVGKKETGVKLNRNGVGFYIGAFDTKTETVQETAIPELPGSTAAVTPIDMDSAGKVLLRQGTNLWVADTKKQTVKMTSGAGVGDYMNSTLFVKNEKGEGVYVAHAYSNRPSTYTVRFYFNLYDFSGTALASVSGYYNDIKGLNGNGISYAKLHSKENKIYIMQGNVADSTVGSQWAGKGYMFSINLPSMTVDTNYSGLGWDVADENGAYNGSLMNTFYSWDRWIGSTDRIKLFRNAISEQEAKTFTLRQNADMGAGESEKYVVVVGYIGAEKILQNQEFKDEIDLRGARSLFLDVKDSITTIADQIKDLGESLKNYLLVEGDSLKNLASVTHEIQLQPDTDYEYEYDMTVTGKAIDLFGVENPNSQGLENDGKYFEKTAAFLDFSSGNPEPFFKLSGGSTSNNWVGYGTEADTTMNSFSITFTMQHMGYFVADLIVPYDKYGNSLTVYIDGAQASNGMSGVRYGSAIIPVKIFLTEGGHVIRFDHSSGNGWGADASIDKLKAVYYYDTVDVFVPAALSGTTNGKQQTVSGSFRVVGQESMEIKGNATKTLTTKSAIEYSKYITSSSNVSYIVTIKELVYIDSKGKPHYTYRDEWRYEAGPNASLNEATGTFSFPSPGYTKDSDTHITIKAPADKLLMFSYTTQFTGTDGSDRSSEGERLYQSTAIRVLRPGQSYEISSLLSDFTGQNTTIKLAEFDVNTLGGAEKLKTMIFNADNLSAKVQSGTDYIRAQFDAATGQVTLKYIADLEPSTGINNGIRLSTSESLEKVSALVSNFALYKKIGGIRQLIFAQDFGSQRALDLTGWKTECKGEGKAEIISAPVPAKEEDTPLIYKKGQLVAYNIFYDDYENDPSKKGYWRYTHTPYNDGPHPQAAFILDEDGNVISSTGAILSESIPRFYIDGKYTVEHWEEDNTNRTGDTSGKVDYSKYDKVSNIESLTFYIEGGGTAPWITSIKTIPATVKEGDQYRLQIGVDDAEKDELRLTTELYKDKKLIYTHKQTRLVADANGNYPLATTGYPPLAEAGKYEVVCTVRDWSGAGLGSYKFTVVSEGRITGMVSHTQSWDENRKKYNLKRFSDEINRIIPFSDYCKLAAPRQRGTNVFWSGEKFILNAETEGKPTEVSVAIMESDGKGGFKNAGYSAVLSKTGAGSSSTEKWQGSLWDKSMINKWGRKKPEELAFLFTAYYSGGITRTYEVKIIIDSEQDYWKLHRLW